MNDIEKRARELLAGEYLNCGHKGVARVIELGAWPVAATPGLRAIIAALSAAPQVPYGWVLVPVEPTDEMSWAAADIEVGYPTWAGSRDSCTEGEAKAIWKAMLAATPEPQA